MHALKHLARILVIVCSCAFVGGVNTAFAQYPGPTYEYLYVVASPSNGGTVAGAGYFMTYSMHTISATANSGWAFTEWHDGDTQSTREVRVSDGGDTYTAYFSAVSPAQLRNISTRLALGTGDNVLIGGFIITGNQAKKVISRASGPSLTQFGVPGALADPMLELHGSAGLITSNDDWKDSQQAEIAASGLAPGNDLESAIIRTLDPGAYTAIVQGVNNTTGVALVETYDLDQADSKLANISTRGFVQTGDNVMIGGLIVQGANAANVLLRGIGPSLIQFGIANTLADPTLHLHDGNGTLITSNDNWKDTQQVAIQASGLPPSNDAESAIVHTFAAGNYTAIVRGKDGSTGVALVEAYHLN